MTKRLVLFAQIVFFVYLSAYPGRESPITIKEWKIIGPMLASPREGATSVPFYPDIAQYQEEDLEYRFFCGNNLKFFDVELKDNKISLESDTVSFIASQNSFGFPGVLNQYYCFSEFEAEDGKMILVYTGGVSSFYVNNRKFIGDPYNHEKVFTPVNINFGKNTFSFITSGYYGYSDAYIKIYESDLPLILNKKSSVAFDIIEDSLLTGYVSVQIVNCTDKDCAVKISEDCDDTIFSVEETSFNIPFLGVKNIPLKIIQKRKASDVKTVSLNFVIYLDSFSIKENLVLNVKKVSDVRKETFVSKTDSSVQYYAVRLPENFSTNNFHNPLILSLHGAGVKAEGQAESYRQTSKSILVCPTNRGEYGFDWQELGRIDFLEVLNTVKEKYSVDLNKISLTGHSMGGHGTMYLGSLYGHLFSSIVPASGWINFNTYIPQTFQRLNLFDNNKVRDNINLLKDAENPLVYADNLRNTPVLIIHGEKDDNVPVFQSRMFYNNLKSYGINTSIIEYPNQGHWFDIEETRGIDCIDSDEIMNFIDRNIRQILPRKSILKTFSLFVSDSSAYAKISRQTKKYEKSTLKIELKLEEIEIETENVEGFVLYSMNSVYKDKMRINIDKESFSAKPESVMIFGKKKNKFSLIKKEMQGNDYSLINYAFYSPFTIIYSTRDSLKEKTYDQAIYLYNLYGQKCLGVCGFISDMSEENIDGRNIVFIGIPDEKSKYYSIFKEMNINITDRKITDGIVEYEGKNLAFVSCKKIKSGSLAIIFCGNSLKGQDLSCYFNPLSSGVYLGEFMVFDEKVKKEGYNGLISCGFY